LKLASGIQARAITGRPRFHFFGYFDKSPWAAMPGSDIVLAHETALHSLPPGPDDVAGIGYVDLQSGAGFIQAGESRAWNFQQGAMLQWVPGGGRRIVFNDRTGTRAIGVVLDLESGRRRTLEAPIAALSHDGRAALGVNFGRLNAASPGYGCAGVEDAYAREACPAGDGIWNVDLETGQPRLLLSTREVASFGGRGDAPGAFHWLNHVLFNPSGRRFCFLHRFRNPAGTTCTRVMTCNRDGSGLRLLISGMASHFDWRTEDELVIWAGERKLLDSAVHGAARKLPVGLILRRLYRALGKPRLLKQRVLRDHYLVLNDRRGTKRVLSHPLLSSDGHCSFSPDRKWMVTDTYPDGSRRTSLMLFEWETGKAFEIARLASPPELEDAVRCDLHPRWSADGKRICIDSADDGQRQMYVLDVSSFLVSAAGGMISEPGNDRRMFESTKSTN
jgi:hypothetical protein